MPTERSTYTYVDGAQETVTLRRSHITPRGHALLQISYSDGRRADCYVNTAWLRDRVNDLDPRPLTPDAVTDEMVERALVVNADLRPETVRRMLTAALTEPPARPEGAEDIEALVEESLSGDALSAAQVRALADFLAARLTDPTPKEA